jgi:AcrR family transcriptional regulator
VEPIAQLQPPAPTAPSFAPAATRREPAARVDGRRVRRDRNVATVVDALLDLFHEGVVHPTAQQLADRSGVSLRSVFRYFDDVQDLVMRAARQHIARCEPLYRLPEPAAHATRDERIARLVAHRARLYHAVAPVVRAARAREFDVPALAELWAERRRVLQAQVATWFAPELDALRGDERRLVLAALDTATQFAALEHLDQQLGLSTEEIEQAVRFTLDRLLPGAAG